MSAVRGLIVLLMSRGKNLRTKLAFQPEFRFFIGVVDDEEVEEELKKEAEEFKDICRLSLVESYQGLLHKVTKKNNFQYKKFSKVIKLLPLE